MTNFRSVLERLGRIEATSNSDKTLKGIQFGAYKSKLIEIQQNLQLVIEKYKEVESRLISA